MFTPDKESLTWNEICVVESVIIQSTGEKFDTSDASRSILTTCVLIVSILPALSIEKNFNV
jgi:hypothetical protein